MSIHLPLINIVSWHDTVVLSHDTVISTERCSHYTMVWASMSLIIPAKEFGAQEPLKRLVNSLGENCQDCEDFLQQVSRKCASFMSNGVML